MVAGEQHDVVGIREIRPAEYDVVADLIVDGYATIPADRGPYEMTLRDVAGRAERCLVLVAEIEARIVGTVTYVREPGPDSDTEDPEAASIRMLAVDPENRGAGIGRRLVEACIAQAGRDGRRRIGLHTETGMLAAQRLYERLGFVREPSLDWSPYPGHRILAYILDLEAGEPAE